MPTEHQIEYTFTMGSPDLSSAQWQLLEEWIGSRVSRRFGGCRFVRGTGVWREGADKASTDGAYFGTVKRDECLTLIVAAPWKSEKDRKEDLQDLQFQIQSVILAQNLEHDLCWIDTTMREVIAAHWDASTCEWRRRSQSSFTAPAG